MNPIFAHGDHRTRQKLLTLRQQAQTDKAPRVALRLQAILLSLDKFSPPQIAQLLHADRSGVHRWVRTWNQYGMEGLKEGHRSGRPPRLTVVQMEALHDLVESGPVAYGLNTGVWTSRILTQVINEEFGVEYDASHVRRLLHKLGCSVQRPTTRLIRAEPAEQRKWVRYTYPNLKKKPKKKER